MNTAHCQLLNVKGNSEPPSHLPAPTYSGLFTLTASATINAPIETAWKVLTDFPQYPEWYVLLR